MVSQEPQLTTMPDKFHMKVCCPHKASGCAWVGEVGVVNQHTDSCPKRPWKCQYCEFTSTSDVGKDHVVKCSKYPIPCPSKCEIGTVPRYDVEKHRAECPLEPVACEFADVGCNVKIARRDLSRHLKESQQQHLLFATLVNLRATIAERDCQLAEKDQQLSAKDKTVAKKDRRLAEKDQQLAEKDLQLRSKDKVIEKVIAIKDETVAKKDHQLAEKDHQIAEKDHQIAEKDKLIKKVVAEKDKRMAEKDTVIVKKDKVIAEKDKQLLELQRELHNFQQGLMKSTEVALDHFLGVGAHEFTLTNFSEYQKRGVCGDWLSDPFYSHPGGYYLKLNVETKEKSHVMKVRLYPVDTGNELDWPVTLIVTLQLLNQLGDHTHYSRQLEIQLQRPSLFNQHSSPHEYISFETLYRKDRGVQYLVEDCLKLRMWINIKTSCRAP